MTPEEVPDILYPHWQQEYEAALIEPDSEILEERIGAAESAIERRLQELAYDSNHYTERQVIRDAQTSLRRLRNILGPSPTERTGPIAYLSFPDNLK
jgi:hypothetical protein